jgi:hypothetical protein
MGLSSLEIMHLRWKRNPHSSSDRWNQTCLSLQRKKLEFSRSWIFFTCLFHTLDSCNGAEEFMNMKQLGENTNVACGSWCLEKIWEFSQEPYRSKKRS